MLPLENGSSSEQAGSWVLVLVTEPRDPFWAKSPANGEGYRQETEECEQVGLFIGVQRFHKVLHYSYKKAKQTNMRLNFRSVLHHFELKDYR